MIPRTTLYDGYIDRPILSEQQKKTFEYIVPPPTKMDRNNKSCRYDLQVQLKIRTPKMLIDFAYDSKKKRKCAGDKVA